MGAPQGNRKGNIIPYRALFNIFVLVLIPFNLIHVVFNNIGYFILDIKLCVVATLIKYFRFMSNILGFGGTNG